MGCCTESNLSSPRQDRGILEPCSVQTRECTRNDTSVYEKKRTVFTLSLSLSISLSHSLSLSLYDTLSTTVGYNCTCVRYVPWPLKIHTTFRNRTKRKGRENKIYDTQTECDTFHTVHKHYYILRHRREQQAPARRVYMNARLTVTHTPTRGKARRERK